MATDLTGIKIKNSYKSLMHVSDFTNGFTASYQQIVDGDGTGIPLYVSTSNIKFGNEVILTEQSAPGTPDSGTGSVYVKANGLLYFKNDSGTEFDLTNSTTLADADYGDVVVSASGTVFTVESYNGGTAFGTMAAATAADYTPTSGLSTVALSNSYNDLTNLPNITELSQDATASLIQNGTGITWSYNDGANTLTPTVSLASFTTDNLAEGSNLYYTNARFNTSFSGKSTSDLVEGTRLYFTEERVDDRVSNLLVAGTNTTLTYDDVANTITIASTGGGGASNWGDLGGTLSDQTDLQDALDLKADISSLATVATSGAYADLSGKPTLGSLAALNDLSSFDTDDLSEGATNKYFDSTSSSKLAGIEAGADVTDATNVDAAGAVMVSDTATTGMGFVIDEDNMASNSDTKVPTQQSVKAYVDANAGGGGGLTIGKAYAISRGGFVN